VSASHHHRHPEESRARRFLRAYRFEIIWLAIVALGAFLVLEQMNIRGTLLGWARMAAAATLHGAGHLQKGIGAFLARTTLSDAVGFLLILSAMVAILWRIRWRLTHSPALTTLRCPKCSGGIHRVHRHRLDRLINLYVPVHRYRCTNDTCRWCGLRVTLSHGTSPATIANRRSPSGT
jgi:hypothetical protein